MRPVALTSTFTIKPYTICQKPLFDNPALAIFLIFLKDKLIGRQISYPCLSDCQWHEYRAGIYAQKHESHYSIVNDTYYVAATRRRRKKGTGGVIPFD